LIEAVQEGMADEQAGDTYSTEEVFEAAGRRIAAIKAK
jgi:hypothetical protein